MNGPMPSVQRDPFRPDSSRLRQLADQAFSRASGAPLREGNRILLLKDAAENYPAWLAAIRAARRTVHFEMYIIHEDAQGAMFADALIERAAQGVTVRLLYDWMGGFGKTSRGFWKRLRAGGVEVRCHNPPRFDMPLGWVSRDHRKVIVVDGTVAFVTGLCVGQDWVGDPARNLDPWRDTGIEMRGPAVADCETAFAEAWATAGPALPAPAAAGQESANAGSVAARVVVTVPYTAGMFRIDQLVAALAANTLWLTDAYFAGTTSYVQALCAAARDGVDVRLLVPGASDIPILRLFSRAGYRPLLQAGVRVFEWNGRMLHAKSAVADGRWARVGSTNLNIASWMGNRELDVVIEDVPFAAAMETMYLEDLERATEVVLDARNRVRAPHPAKDARAAGGGGTGSAGRAVAGAVRIGHAVSAAITNRRVLEPVESHIALVAGGLLLAFGFVAYKWPRGLSWPLAAIFTWLGVVLLFRGFRLHTRHD